MWKLNICLKSVIEYLKLSMNANKPCFLCIWTSKYTVELHNEKDERTSFQLRNLEVYGQNNGNRIK